jgi:uncharacterized membrane protein
VKWLVNNFLKGCLVLFPVAGTVWVVWSVLRFVDDLFPVKTPGLGVLLTFAIITAVGAVASNVVGRRVVGLVDWLLGRVPLVALLYGSIRDLVGALVGERRAFDQPAVVELADGVRVLGFVTCDRFEDPALAGHVAVYLPQSYNWAGNLVVVPASRVRRVDQDGARFMAFVLSGGISRAEAARASAAPRAEPLPG